MGDSSVVPSSWRHVEVGRVVLFSNASKYENRIAVIVEIIDSKRILIDGPSEKHDPIPRQAVLLSHVTLTPLFLNIPRTIRPGHLAAKWKEAGIEKKWGESVFAQGRDRSAKRRALNDFERFKVMRLRKQVRHDVRKSFAKIKASS